MALPPLTHHEIIGLIEPFTRRGRHPDLAASDRIERRLVFKAVQLAGATSAAPGLTESLTLENPRSGTYRLTRVLTDTSGLAASAEAEGDDPGELIMRIESLGLAEQFGAGEGFALARSYRLEPSADARATTAAPLLRILVRGQARAHGLVLTFKAPTVRGMPADIELSAAPGESLDIPQDLLAVLGWKWTALDRFKDVWRGSVRIRGREPERSRDGEAKLEMAARHLGRTLAEAPARFHERLLAARWGVALRRAVPLLACVILIGGAAAVPILDLAQESVVRMLIFNSPPLLMLLVFSMREVPRIVVPPVPRRSDAPAWRRAARDGPT